MSCGLGLLLEERLLRTKGAEQLVGTELLLLCGPSDLKMKR